MKLFGLRLNCLRYLASLFLVSLGVAPAFAQDCGSFSSGTFTGGPINGGNFTSPANNFLNKGYFTPLWLTLEDPQFQPHSSSFDSSETYYDRVYDVVTTTTFNDVLWTYSFEPDRPGRDTIPMRDTSDPYRLSVDSTNLFRWISHGTGDVTISYTTPWQYASTEVSAGSTEIARTLSRFVRRTAALNAATNIDKRIAGKTFDANAAMYSTYDPSSFQFIRNPQFWAADIDLTCLAAYNDFGWSGQGGPQRAGTLISPRHFLCASHFWMPVGTVMYFVTADNTVIRRGVTDILGVGLGNGVGGSADIMVGVLDADVPSGINFAKVLPSDWILHLVAPEDVPTVSEFPWPVPVLNVNQFRQGLVADVFIWGPGSLGPGLTDQVCSSQFPSNAQRHLFYRDLIPGDSGGPSFLIINNTAVLLTQWTNGGGGQGDQDAYYISAINAAMAQLGGGYQLTEIDLNGFVGF